MDETLYDMHADPGEASNIAYDGEQLPTRQRLLELCVTQWRLRLRGPLATTRRVRWRQLRSTLGQMDEGAPVPKEEAQGAIDTMNGEKIMGQEIAVDWAFSSGPTRSGGGGKGGGAPRR